MCERCHGLGEHWLAYERPAWLAGAVYEASPRRCGLCGGDGTAREIGGGG